MSQSVQRFAGPTSKIGRHAWGRFVVLSSQRFVPIEFAPRKAFVSAPVYTFGPFKLDLSTGELRKHETRVRVPEQPLRLLTLLLENDNRVVTRQELRERIWPGQTLGDFDDSLNASVKKLRETLGDDPGKPLYIETIPRRGYRFIAPVRRDHGASVPVESTGGKLVVLPAAQKRMDDGDALLAKISAAASAKEAPSRPTRAWPRWSRVWVTSLAILVFVCIVLLWAYLPEQLRRASAAGNIRSIAVLPFENLTGDREQDYLADGLTDVVITDLAQLGAVRVTSRSSAMRYKGLHKTPEQIRRDLNVDAIVEGSVIKSGKTIRVNAQLIHASEGQYLWARSFESRTGDIVELQDDVARSVATSIQWTIGSGFDHRQTPRPQNIAAYQEYLHGLFFLNHRTNDDLRKSVQYFDRATTLDPGLAPAYAGTAYAYGLLADYDGMRAAEAAPRAEAAARKAIELDDSASAGHAALAFVLWKYDWDWNGSAAEFQRALALNPNDSNTHHLYGLFLACRGDFKSALEHLEKAEQLDPLSLITRTNLAWISYYQRDFPTAVAGYQDVLRLDPQFVVAHQKLWITYAMLGDREHAVEELSQVFRFFGHADLAERVDHAEERARYDVALKTYIDSGFLSAYERARLCSLAGRKQEALKALEEAASQRSAWMIYLGVEPAFDSIRSTAEFRKLSARANIPFESVPEAR